MPAPEGTKGMGAMGSMEGVWVRLAAITEEVAELREQLTHPVRPLSVRTCPHPYRKPPEGKMLVVEANGDAWFRDAHNEEQGDLVIRWCDVEVIDHSLYQVGLGLGLVVRATSTRVKP